MTHTIGFKPESHNVRQTNPFPIPMTPTSNKKIKIKSNYIESPKVVKFHTCSCHIRDEKSKRRGHGFGFLERTLIISQLPETNQPMM